MGEVGPGGAAVLAWIAAGWIFLNSPVDGSLNFVIGGLFAIFGVAILTGVA